MRHTIDLEKFKGYEIRHVITSASGDYSKRLTAIVNCDEETVEFEVHHHGVTRDGQWVATATQHAHLSDAIKEYNRL